MRVVEKEGESYMSFQDILDHAEIGEMPDDPRVGKYPDASLVTVSLKESQKVGTMIVLEWGVLNGSAAFTVQQYLYPPTLDSLDFPKKQFMRTLKNLGVVPREYPKVLFPDIKGIKAIEESIQAGCVGKQFPITVSEYNDMLRVQVDKK